MRAADGWYNCKMQERIKFGSVTRLRLPGLGGREGCRPVSLFVAFREAQFFLGVGELPFEGEVILDCGCDLLEGEEGIEMRLRGLTDYTHLFFCVVVLSPGAHSFFQH